MSDNAGDGGTGVRPEGSMPGARVIGVPTVFLGVSAVALELGTVLLSTADGVAFRSESESAKGLADGVKDHLQPMDDGE